MNRLILFVLFAFSVHNANSQTTELGTVDWMRDYDEALALSEKYNKPVFILFQEIPGCATCRNYGSNVLSEPLIADAIESYFVPLVIHNNKRGEDARILQKYNEPSWNNPVVRIVNASGQPINDRLAGNYTAAGLVDYMSSSFPKYNQAVPEFISYLQDAYSLNDYRVKTTDFSMYCFWSGEGHIGQADGVVSTEPGFKNGREIVRVTYDPSKTNEKKLNKFAKEANCQPFNGDGKFRADRDPQYYLKQTEFKYLALTPNQRTKINSMLASRQNPRDILSPKQIAYLDNLSNVKNPKVLYDKDFESGWEMMDL